MMTHKRKLPMNDDEAEGKEVGLRRFT